MYISINKQTNTFEDVRLKAQEDWEKKFNDLNAEWEAQVKDLQDRHEQEVKALKDRLENEFSERLKEDEAKAAEEKNQQMVSMETEWREKMNQLRQQQTNEAVARQKVDQVNVETLKLFYEEETKKTRQLYDKKIEEYVKNVREEISKEYDLKNKYAVEAQELKMDALLRENEQLKRRNNKLEMDFRHETDKRSFEQQWSDGNALEMKKQHDAYIQDLEKAHQNEMTTLQTRVEELEQKFREHIQKSQEKNKADVEQVRRLYEVRLNSELLEINYLREQMQEYMRLANQLQTESNQRELSDRQLKEKQHSIPLLKDESETEAEITTNKSTCGWYLCFLFALFLVWKKKKIYARCVL
ncbi:hypothetical protein RFI_37992 [Reticulomyxa filosa]|uniref:Uncharacterized protein n=1 Tax=Reticulomyxa filosa TaxID=46433 RepID=X6LFH2_RETFI|nr:hypothetical protein RFI_37992 [Reticulomyxa filosa]|eukprot:ETN99479.1 hypothetical protein RFI_37992 [Reticulomyxa filosa]